MATEALLQVGILILTLSLFLVMTYLRNQTLHARTRARNRDPKPEANRHLAQASRLLALARPRDAKAALTEADRALSLNPREPTAHILRARALRIMGHHAAALRSMDSALWPPAVRLLSTEDRADALVERAELKLAVNRRRRIDSAVEDLIAAVELSEGERVDSEALCLLGKCYESKGMKDKAKEAFRKVLDVEPDSIEARNGLDRLGP
ncbi:hypothetical protein HN51_013513 [Arachis hypogaea]|uniref:Uncharacterized protein n=1 Tax=Arachis hypogaea TaxID=3818 RepID=A0A445DPY7_ARAHY|nr:uncharacterized protein LOC112791727 [Arachis hypogaea]RYR65233.1 hypothetical protein Ahy_A03g011190 [Arachis hypogaea]